jgi:hypothetical protein
VNALPGLPGGVVQNLPFDITIRSRGGLLCRRPLSKPFSQVVADHAAVATAHTLSRILLTKFTVIFPRLESH